MQRIETMIDFQPPSSLPSSAKATEVDLTWIGGKIEHRLAFGHPVAERVIDAEHRVILFSPGSTFSVIRWASNDYGSIITRIEILRAARAGESYTRVPFMRPGAELLLRVSGWSDVQRTIQIIDAVQATNTDPADAAPDYWLHVGNRLAAGDRPRAYSRARHLAWQLRRRFGQ
jgi:hypothetical protein